MRISARRIAAAAGALVVVGVIIWIDVRTSVWQELVILSGLAAGLVTFILTALVLDRILERSAARRWAPVTRLALTEILHGLADDELSEPTRGVIVVRRLVAPESLGGSDSAAQLEASHRLRVTVVEERKNLAATLGIWSSFLASSEASAGIMRRIAAVTLQLENVRDASLEFDNLIHLPGAALALEHLRAEVAETNDALAAVGNDIEEQLMADAAR